MPLVRPLQKSAASPPRTDDGSCGRRRTHRNDQESGVPDAVEQSLAALTPHLASSVSYWPLDALWPPPADVRTLVIRDVQDLALAEQQALSLWKVFSIEQPPSVARV
jgi:hypothetical protein